MVDETATNQQDQQQPIDPVGDAYDTYDKAERVRDIFDPKKDTENDEEGEGGEGEGGEGEGGEGEGGGEGEEGQAEQTGQEGAQNEPGSSPEGQGETSPSGDQPPTEAEVPSGNETQPPSDAGAGPEATGDAGNIGTDAGQEALKGGAKAGAQKGAQAGTTEAAEAAAAANSTVNETTAGMLGGAAVIPTAAAEGAAVIPTAAAAGGTLAADAALTAGATAAGAGATAATGGLAAPIAAVAIPVALAGAKKGWKYKWWLIGLLAIVMFGGIAIVYFIFAKFFSFDQSSPANQASVSAIETDVSSGKIVFDFPGDLDKIKNGEIGESPLKVMELLAGKHEKLGIHYTDTSGESSENQASFSIMYVDEIKCTDSSSSTKSSFPIFLSSTYNWKQHAATDDKMKCAVGYYPGIEDKKEGPYSARFGPGEFSLAKIETAGKMAAQEKLAEITSEVLDDAKTAVASEKRQVETGQVEDANMKPTEISLDSALADKNMKDGTDGVLSVLKSKINEIYPGVGQGSEAVKGVPDMPFGFKISYL